MAGNVLDLNNRDFSNSGLAQDYFSVLDIHNMDFRILDLHNMDLSVLDLNNMDFRIETSWTSSVF